MVGSLEQNLRLAEPRVVEAHQLDRTHRRCRRSTYSGSAPAQRLILAAIEGAGSGVDVATRLTRRLGAATGIFNLLWVVVVVLMIFRPGSTTGV